MPRKKIKNPKYRAVRWPYSKYKNTPQWSFMGNQNDLKRSLDLLMQLFYMKHGNKDVSRVILSEALNSGKSTSNKTKSQFHYRAKSNNHKNQNNVPKNNHKKIASNKTMHNILGGQIPPK